MSLPFFDFFKDDRANIHSIRERTLKMILEGAKSSEPDEFGAFLSAEKGVINELVLLPGTISGTSHAIFQMHMLPVDFSIVGTVHSHPSGVCLPSNADLQLFGKYGWIHIIVCSPFEMDCWAVFNIRGEPIGLDVVD